MKTSFLQIALALFALSFSKPAYAETEIIHLDAAGAAALLAKDKEVVVLDVRTKDENADGHIAGALNIDYNGPDFAQKAKKLLDPTVPILVHCAVGGRSTAALAQLKPLGFARIYHLDGGFNDW
ncbi:MAG: rhodanese-like domain-containing protein [Verrucomicrobiales bacterium]